MARRMTNAEIQGVVVLIIIGMPIYAVIQFGESVGWLPLGLFTLAFLSLVVWFKFAQKQKRRSFLMEKYNNDSLVEDLMNQTFWQGQTAGQLLDSLGKPHDIDQKILKTKKKEVWKYNHQGSNRYGLRITLDNDNVVGWDQK